MNEPLNPVDSPDEAALAEDSVETGSSEAQSERSSTELSGLAETASLTEPKAVQPAPVGVVAMVGHSCVGPEMIPVRCQSESDFNKHFGDIGDAPTLAMALNGFFSNGGKCAYVLNLGAEERPLKAQDLGLLNDLGEVELVCAPGKTTPSDYQHLIDFVTSKRPLLAILDGPRDTLDQIVRFHPPMSHSAALYVPWLSVHDPVNRRSSATPPSGHMAGLMARVAFSRGIHKAPANEVLQAVSGLDREITQGEHDILHPRRINCIRQLPKLAGIRPWGAQTLAQSAPFRSITAYRTWSYVVRSFESGCPWLSSEINGPDLWSQLEEAGRAFLTELWRAGALAGVTPELAFRIRCDEQLNPPKRQREGMVFLEIGLALAKPNSFYTFQMGIGLDGEP